MEEPMEDSSEIPSEGSVEAARPIGQTIEEALQLQSGSEMPSTDSATLGAMVPNIDEIIEKAIEITPGMISTDYIQNIVSQLLENSANMDPNAKRRSYNLEFKSLVVKVANSTDNSKAAKLFGVPRQCVQHWKAMVGNLNGTKNMKNKKRLSGGGRHVKNEELDAKLAEWVKSQGKVTRSQIQEYARTVSEDNNFKASNGWIGSFLKRHKIDLKLTDKEAEAPSSELEAFLNNMLVRECTHNPPSTSSSSSSSANPADNCDECKQGRDVITDILEKPEAPPEEAPPPPIRKSNPLPPVPLTFTESLALERGIGISLDQE